MKYLVLILFCTFVLQRDTTKVDTLVVQQAQSVQKKFDTMNNKLDSLITILENDTIKKH
jgi:hypothetical protein